MLNKKERHKLMQLLKKDPDRVTDKDLAKIEKFIVEQGVYDDRVDLTVINREYVGTLMDKVKEILDRARS